MQHNEAAIHFIQHCQNLPSHNTQAWVSRERQDRGGFVYLPGESKAGETTDPATGRTVLRSYGSISYAGLLSYIYADLAPDDHRVKSAYRWAIDHWTLDENPGTGQQGLYYYINVLTKGLNVMGKDVIRTRDGKELHWRSEVIRRLIELQKQAESALRAASRFPHAPAKKRRRPKPIRRQLSIQRTAPSGYSGKSKGEKGKL